MIGFGSVPGLPVDWARLGRPAASAGQGLEPSEGLYRAIWMSYFNLSETLSQEWSGLGQARIIPPVPRSR